MNPRVTIVTPTTGNPLLRHALDGVARQTYSPIQHLVVIDGAERAAAARAIIGDRPVDILELPHATGKDRFNGHRIYGASPFLASGELIAFLDEDNWPEPDHIMSLVDVLAKGNDWAYSFRRIVLPDGLFVCNDDCESLGKWPSVHGGEDYLVDVNCYLLPKTLAVTCAPVWYRKAGDPNVMEVDRALTRLLREKAAGYDGSYKYTMNYRTGNTGLSVTADFFIKSNAIVAKRYGSALPWKSVALRGL
jgi:glycosyltransferase involved in cell wall biosynthesis